MEQPIQLPLPKNIDKLPSEVQTSIMNYLNQLDEKEKKAYLIALSHLGSSFNLIKSIGYLKWKISSTSSTSA
jgi:hypothetical protein